MSLSKNNKVCEYKGIILPFPLVRFMAYRRLGYLFSLIVIITCCFFIFTKGFNWGLDFTGGMVIDTTSQPADSAKSAVNIKENGESISTDHRWCT